MKFNSRISFFQVVRYYCILCTLLFATMSAYCGQDDAKAGAANTVNNSSVILTPSLRRAFRRMETNARITLTAKNISDTPIEKSILFVTCNGKEAAAVQIPTIAANSEIQIPVAIDTILRPGKYVYGLTVQNASGTVLATVNVETWIVARRPERMPVVMWGYGDIKQVQQAGFTHSFLTLQNWQKLLEDGKAIQSDTPENIERNAKILDQALIDNFEIVGYICPGEYLNTHQAELLRIGRDRKVLTGNKNICGNLAKAKEYCHKVGVSVAMTYGEFPAFDSALVETETRDASNLCFHKEDKDAFRKFAGYEIPAAVPSKMGLSYTQIPNFPSDRIIPDNYPGLNYLRWFWQKGDGWNNLYSQTNSGLKSTGRNNIWTFCDPAIRVPSVSGSGGDVDIISQWTYTYPDPIKIGKATDELFAMADLSSNPNQKVMKMTQAIWYRSETAPKREPGEYKDIPLTEWEKKHPDVNYITIAPDHLREAFWCKISRPVRGIMYHGFDVFQNYPYKPYTGTNPQSLHVLKELVDTVVTPLGPALLQVPDMPSDMAFLQSFASEMLAGTGEFGWGWGWGNDAYQILQYAQLQPLVVYDETILRDRLKGYKVLVLAKCPVLTKKVAAVIKQFQDSGGIIIGDEMLAPAITPDILMQSYASTDGPRKAALQAKARKLRDELDDVYSRQADSSNPDVIVRLRRYKTSDYLFAVNDLRTYGDYVGQYHKVMEKGLPTGAILQLNRTEGYVYDLVKHEAVPSELRKGKLSISVKLGPGDGKLLLITEKPIGQVEIHTPESAKRGKSFDANIAITDAAGQPIQAVVPLEVTITDAENKPAEFTGFYGAKDGVLKLQLFPASNEPTGKWTIKVCELASGKNATKTIQLLP